MTGKALNIHIPKINLHYWILMILATTIGEIVGNLISRNMGLGYSTGSMLLIGTYVVAMILIAVAGKENASVYWLLIIMGNIAGTNCADFITIEPLKLGTIWGSLLVMGILAFILIVWKIIAPKENMDKGLTGKTYFLYWFAILTSSTFGTTSGDLLSNDTPLGAGWGSLLLIGILGIFAILNNYKKASREILYWSTLVVMHPVGATIGNYISKPAGLNFGNVWTSAALISVFLFLFLKKNRFLNPKLG